MTPAELFAEVVRRAPQFELRVHEHLRDYDALLPHVLMADLLRFVGGFFTEPPGAGVATEAEVAEILRLLEAEVLGGDAETENVIAVSFIEHLEVEEFFVPLLGRLGPNLRREHDKMRWSNAG